MDNITAAQVDERYAEWYAYRTSLGLSTSTPPPVAVQPKKKKESDMNIATATTSAMSTITTELPGRREKDYLLSRLDTVTTTHTEKLRKEYHMDPDKPKTPRELHKMLKDGHFELNEKMLDRRMSDYGEDTKEEDVCWGYYLWEYITFRNPKHKKDADGYEKAKEKLSKARQSTKDLIIVKSPEDGLMALEAFEKETFH